MEGRRADDSVLTPTVDVGVGHVVGLSYDREKKSEKSASCSSAETRSPGHSKALKKYAGKHIDVEEGKKPTTVNGGGKASSKRREEISTSACGDS